MRYLKNKFFKFYAIKNLNNLSRFHADANATCDTEWVEFVLKKTNETIPELFNEVSSEIFILDDAKVHENGDIDIEKEWFHPDEYCIQRYTQTTLKLVIPIQMLYGN